MLYPGITLPVHNGFAAEINVTGKTPLHLIRDATLPCETVVFKNCSI